VITCKGSYCDGRACFPADSLQNRDVIGEMGNRSSFSIIIYYRYFDFITGKDKVVPVLFSTEHHVMKAC
jgi:hypothetical protein